MVEQAISDTANKTINLILDDDTAARVLRLLVYDIALGGIARSRLVYGAREDAGQVLALIVARIVLIKLLGVRDGVAPDLAAELHAGEGAGRLIFSNWFLHR